MITDSDFLQTIFTTGNLALWTTIILLIIGLPVAYFLSYTDFHGKSVNVFIICMPMVLILTVLGFYLLVAYSSQNFLGVAPDKHFNLAMALFLKGVMI